MEAQHGSQKLRSRGAAISPAGRFAKTQRVLFDDGWEIHEEGSTLKTQVFADESKTILSRNESPDIPFNISVNAYRGCEHGCVYCFARPTHEYFDLSAGLDFESRIFAKHRAAELLEREFRKPRYVPETIAMSGVTDIYQPVERQLRITRSLLDVFRIYRHPVALITKSRGVLRDIDLLRDLAEDDLVRVYISITTLDSELARRMEPRAATPAARLEALSQLSAAGIQTGVMLAPQIPFINDHEIEAILARARQAGAATAGFITLRLPWSLKEIFSDWLTRHFPERAEKVLGQLKAMHGGQEYKAEFFSRMRGEGPYAEMLARRFAVAAQKNGFMPRHADMNTRLFRAPAEPIHSGVAQLRLFS
ncbi:MAG: PA0069 family radical SAM protein [Turneriella sp.]